MGDAGVKKSYKEMCGRGGFVRSNWDEVSEISAALDINLPAAAAGVVHTVRGARDLVVLSPLSITFLPHAIFVRRSYQPIGIDTGKNTLHYQWTIVLHERLGRGRVRARLTNVPRGLIGIEAGMATHYLARELIAIGHDVRQVPPVYARRFRQTHKNDFRDAYAITEAVRRAVNTLRSGKDRRSVGLTSIATGAISFDQ